MEKLSSYFIREQVIYAIRDFFGKRGFHEVIAPVMDKTVPLEPNLYPFSTVWQVDKSLFYLSLSPEKCLKSKLALGVGDCYCVGKSFRNLEGSGPLHLPEFLMLEWYRENACYGQIMADTGSLVRFVKKRVDKYLHRKDSNILSYQSKQLDLSGPWQNYSLVDLYRKFAEIRLGEALNDEKMAELAKSKGYQTEGATWENLFNQIFLNEIEPHLPPDPLFLTDFPARISPLCRVKKDDPDFAERFEFYMGGMEMGNGNTESTDIKVIMKVFKEEEKLRKARDLDPQPVDYEFIRSLEKMKGKSYAGIGLGVDRLVLLMADIRDISELI